MKHLAAMIASAFAACSMAEPSPVQVVDVGQPFTLRPGEVARVGSGLSIEFEGVTADSRCPKGEQCVRAGDATVRIGLRLAPGVRQVAELKTAAGAPPARLPGLEVRLVGLTPHPVTGRTIAPRDHVATLSVDPSGTSEPTR